MFRRCLFRGGSDVMAAIGGIDMALWDIAGKAANQPVYQLLGGPTRERVRVYAHLGGETPEAMADNARDLLGRVIRRSGSTPSGRSSIQPCRVTRPSSARPSATPKRSERRQVLRSTS
ncbi:MAG: hypothetical protein IIC93_09660 [Chloroflexi bacterium]|nr:hypothetical protein [Chloroflexota bacterium]